MSYNSIHPKTIPLEAGWFWELFARFLLLLVFSATLFAISFFVLLETQRGNRRGLLPRSSNYLMMIQPIKTRILAPPQDDLLVAIRAALPSVPEKSVLAITSKVVSVHEGRCVTHENFPDKDALIQQEAEQYLPRDFTPYGWVMHTTKNHMFIPSAGVDESNGNGYYILWPKNPRQSARGLWEWARKEYGVRELGIVITDSHTIPMRRGVLGISLSHWGFAPVEDIRGQKDLFGREFAITTIDVADGLAAAAVAVMGEGTAPTPLALISDVPFVRFIADSEEQKTASDFHDFPLDADLYGPFLKSVPWRKGGGGIVEPRNK